MGWRFLLLAFSFFCSCAISWRYFLLAATPGGIRCRPYKCKRQRHWIPDQVGNDGRGKQE